jgi:hypothetical protein
MQRLEVSCAVWPIYGSLGAKRLKSHSMLLRFVQCDYINIFCCKSCFCQNNKSFEALLHIQEHPVTMTGNVVLDWIQALKLLLISITQKLQFDALITFVQCPVFYLIVFRFLYSVQPTAQTLTCRWWSKGKVHLITGHQGSRGGGWSAPR